MNKIKLLVSSYVVLLVALFFYSFTQVDLSLTLSRVSIFQQIEKQFQYVGFFQRPLSAEIFSVILFLLFIFYFTFLYFAKKQKLSAKYLKYLVFLTFIILVFSYNAFSYDLFNYIFDAKIVTFYHQNPYIHKALDFAGDPMLSFMRWTHRLYPYGPSWLFLTVPLSFLGRNLFIPTFLLFKLLIGLSFLGSCYLIYKISGKIFPEHKIFNTVFWALNPLVLIEGLVSAHNDMPMIFFGLLSIYLYLNKKTFYSFLSYFFSVLIKFSTGALLPAFAYAFYMERIGKKINWEKVFVFSVMLSLLTVIVASFRTTFQPWYLVFGLSLSAFISKKYYILIPSIVLSIFASSIYIPYVYLTDYAKNYPSSIFNLELIGIVTTFVLTFVYFLNIKFLKKD